MYKIIKILFILLFTLNITYAKSAIFLTPQEKDFLAKNQPLKFHNELNWPPYNFNENGKAKGFSIDFMNLATKKLGVEIEYISGPNWNQFMEMLKNDEIDAIINISKNSDRSKYFDFTSVFHTAANAIYVKNGNEHIDSLKKLEGKTIIMPKGFFASQLLKEYYPKINQILVKDSLEALRALSLGKADATIGKKNVLDYIISTKNISGVVASNYVDDNRLVSLIRVATSKNKPLLNSILEKAQKSISDEEILNLKRKWFGANEVKQAKRNFLTDEEKEYLKSKNIINMCNIVDLKPIEFKEDNKVKGISIDLLKIIEDKIDIKFQTINTISWEQTKEYLKEGICDIIPSITDTEELVEFANITKPILNYKLAIITQKGKPVVQNLEEVIDKTMAKKKSSDLIKLLKSSYPDIKILQTKSDYETLEAVNSNRVYFAIEPLPIASYYMSKYALNNIFISRYTNMSYTASIAVNYKDNKLLNILNKALDEINENEQLKIFNKWTNVSINEPFNYAAIWKIVIIALIILAIVTYRQTILNKHNQKLKSANNEIEKKTIELAKQKELFEKLYSKSSDGVLLIKDSRIIDCNEASLKILKYEKDEIIEKLLCDISPKIQADNLTSKVKAKIQINEALKNGVCNFEWIFINKQNQEFWVEIVLTAIEIDNEPVIHTVIRDIDNRKKMEKELEILTHKLEDKINEEIKKNQEKTTQLIQQSRLAQMGEMISMIAHQWRQPLTAISATTNNLLLKIMLNQKLNDEELKYELELITDYSQHLSSTIDDFRNFFKTDKIKIECTLEELINKSLNIIKTSFESNNIELETNYQFNEYIYVYSTEIQQVILNILKNAEDVLTDKDSFNRKIKIKTYEKDNFATIEIIDNGGGISNEIINNIFDPYFSTKKAKEGSGLGLYMSKTIINEHCQGYLTAQNSELGATFKIKLPINNNDGEINNAIS
jgi:two-component system, NarL family, sensor histidine kinase EvgS